MKMTTAEMARYVQLANRYQWETGRRGFDEENLVRWGLEKRLLNTRLSVRQHRKRLHHALEHDFVVVSQGETIHQNPDCARN